MPPKTRITEDMIIQAAVRVARRDGYEQINARTVARELGCSTQPVMYHFSTIDSLKRAAFARADQLHGEYLMRVSPGVDPVLSIGLQYIRFAVEEPQLFRFLFQSGFVQENSLMDMIRSEALEPVLAVMRESAGLDAEQTRAVFLTVAMFAHGYASIIANNGLTFDETLIAEHLTLAWTGAVLAARQENDDESDHSRPGEPL